LTSFTYLVLLGTVQAQLACIECPRFKLWATHMMAKRVWFLARPR